MTRYMSIGEFAKLTGVSQRTLRYYDQIGLLAPSHISDSGRRFYDESDLIPLQHIIALKYLEFSLDEIRAALPQRPASLKESLALQKEAIRRKQDQLAQMQKAIDYSMSVMEDGELDTQLISFLIHSVLKEKEHLRWLAQHFPEPTVETLTEVMRTRELELTKRSVDIMQALKRDLPLYEPGHPRLQSHVAQLMEQVAEIFGPGFRLEDLDIDAEALDHVPDAHVSPFTREEEEKLQQVFECYAQQQKGEKTDV